MTKYIITSGHSVIENISENEVKVSKDENKAMIYDSFGDAARGAIKANSFLSSYSYKVCSVER